MSYPLHINLFSHFNISTVEATKLVLCAFWCSVGRPIVYSACPSFVRNMNIRVIPWDHLMCIITEKASLAPGLTNWCCTLKRTGQLKYTASHADRLYTQGKNATNFWVRDWVNRKLDCNDREKLKLLIWSVLEVGYRGSRYHDTLSQSPCRLRYRASWRAP
jgi:hypothetical protein